MGRLKVDLKKKCMNPQLMFSKFKYLHKNVWFLNKNNEAERAMKKIFAFLYQ